MYKMVPKVNRSVYYPLSIKRGSKLICPNNVRFVQRDVLLRPYISMFRQIVRNAKDTSKELNSQKNEVYFDIIKVINNIVPNQFFGIQQHRKLFDKVVKLILTQSINECINARQLIKGYDMCSIPWLSSILKKNISEVHKKMQAKRYFYEALIWLLEKIIKPLILQYFCIIKTGQMYEVQFVPRTMWRHAKEQAINGMIDKGHISLALYNPISVRGILQFRPKGGIQNYKQFRPILIVTERSKRLKNLKKHSKAINRMLRTAADKMCFTKTDNFFQLWKNFVCITGTQNIYGVKLDIQDAFGNIDIKLLCNILEALGVNNTAPSKVIKSLQYHIQEQFVYFNKPKSEHKNVYKWNHGILQGDCFSSALCQLYLSYQDKIHLNGLCSKNTFLHRTVDDYLFCSTNMQDVQSFINIMNAVHPLNIHKTESNIPEYGQNELPYCGHIIDLTSKEVKGLYKFKPHTEIRHRYKFWSLNNITSHKNVNVERFLEKSMTYFSNQYHFKSLELNTIFNKLKTVIQNYFHAMILLAFKFDAAVMNIYPRIKDFKILTQRVIKVVHMCSRRALRILNNNKGQYATDILSFELLLTIGFQAFILVMKKRVLYKKHAVLTSLIKYMKRIRLTKSMKIAFEVYCKKIPQPFNNISLRRRLPHEKN